MKIRRERVSAAPAQACSPQRSSRVDVTRPPSAPSANAISNFPEADFRGLGFCEGQGLDQILDVPCSCSGGVGGGADVGCRELFFSARP
jgi:hypothetical protein